MSKFYLTSAIPYVNAKPHIGHALEFVQADVIARYHRLIGDEVMFLSGGDENALKNVQAAQQAGIEIQKFVDQNTRLYQDLADKLKVSFDLFIKGSDKNHHYPSSQKLWQLCAENGDIYKKAYQGLYCLGCEAFYATSELNENGECPEHPGKKLEEVKEENYFFRLSKHQQALIKLIETEELKIAPAARKNEMLSFLKQPLKDLSISRTNERARNWGVPVPNDPLQRIYVWFDALNIYQSGIGFGWNDKLYEKWWPADLHVIGKGILRFHAIYWPAFLLSAKLALPKTIFVHGYLTVNSQKMSKTVGNVVDPVEIINEYGSDALRYYLLREVSAFSDGDFSKEKLKTLFNSALANDLGNLASRLAKMSQDVNLSVDAQEYQLEEEIQIPIKDFEFDKALKIIWEKIRKVNAEINEHQVWSLDAAKRKEILITLINQLRQISVNLAPFLPETAGKLRELFQGPRITVQKPLFPRK